MVIASTTTSTGSSGAKELFQSAKSPSPSSLSPPMALDKPLPAMITRTEGDMQLMSEGPLQQNAGNTVSNHHHRPGFNMNTSLIDDDDVLASSSSPPAPSYPPSTSLIDNSVLVYVPMQLRCGVTVLCRPDVMARCPSVLRNINKDVQACLSILPRSVHALVRRTQIWVNTTFYYGPRAKPRNVNHSTAHHHEGWLLWARDKPEKAQSIEIYNCFDYEAMRLHWNGCGLLLHEFCHLIHQFALPDGLENDTVKEQYTTAKNSGLYENILRRDWAGMECEHDMAYAMVNHKEFFSEMSVAYLSDGYCELDAAGCTSMDRCSPPLMAPAAVKRVQSKRRTIMPIDGTAPNSSSRRVLGKRESAGTATGSDNGKGLIFLFRSLGKDNSSRRDTLVPHCNKFYPFTRGQLREHDPGLFTAFSAIWNQVTEWEDEMDGSRMQCCWAPWPL